MPLQHGCTSTPVPLLALSMSLLLEEDDTTIRTMSTAGLISYHQKGMHSKYANKLVVPIPGLLKKITSPGRTLVVLYPFFRVIPTCTAPPPSVLPRPRPPSSSPFAPCRKRCEVNSQTTKACKKQPEAVAKKRVLQCLMFGV